MPAPPTDSPAVDLPNLLAAAARGEERAWAEVLRLYGRRVYAMARAHCRDDNQAEEIAQSVFVTVATKLAGGGYAELGRFESWLFRVTMNRVRDEARRQKRHAIPTDPSTLSDLRVAGGAGEGLNVEGVGRLRAAMARLSDADRQVVELRHHGALSFQQIAETLDEPMGTVLARHHRALKKLKALIEEAEQAKATP